MCANICIKFSDNISWYIRKKNKIMHGMYISNIHIYNCIYMYNEILSHLLHPIHHQ